MTCETQVSQGTRDALDADAERLMALLRAMGAVGRARAASQALIARSLGMSTRHLQDATLRCNERGVPVASSCVEPMGIYLAETVGELSDYGEQLRSRLVGNAHRLRCVRRIEREWSARHAVEPRTGQRRLFA